MNQKLIAKVILQEVRKLQIFGSDTNSEQLVEKAQKKIRKIFDTGDTNNRRFKQLTNISLSVTEILQKNDSLAVIVTNSKQRYFQKEKRKQPKFMLFNPQQQTAQTLNQQLYAIGTGKINLPHSKCIGFSQTLYKDQLMYDSEGGFPKVVGLTNQQYTNEKQLKQNLCALANEGGGIILGGIKQENQKRVQGVNLQNFDLQNQKERIYSMSKTICPPLKVLLNYIPIYNNNLHDFSYKKQQFQSCYCIKISVIVPRVQRIYYLTLRNQGHHQLYQVYHFREMHQLSMQNTNIIEYLLQEVSDNEIYDKIQKKFRSKKKKNLGLVLLQFQQGIGKQKENNIVKTIKKKKQINEKQHLQIQQISLTFKELRQSQQPKFSYKQQSLLVVGSEKKNQFVEMFRKSLMEENKKFILSRAFQKFLIKGGRVVWFFSYEQKFSIMQNFIKKCDKGNNFILIPVTKVLRVPSKKMTQVKQQSFLQNFNKIYPEEEIIVQMSESASGINKSLISCNFYIFPNFQTAIFGFCLLQWMNIQCYCVHQKDILKKKKIFQSNQLAYEDYSGE